MATCSASNFATVGLLNMWAGDKSFFTMANGIFLFHKKNLGFAHAPFENAKMTAKNGPTTSYSFFVSEGRRNKIRAATSNVEFNFFAAASTFLRRAS